MEEQTTQIKESQTINSGDIGSLESVISESPAVSESVITPAAESTSTPEVSTPVTEPTEMPVEAPPVSPVLESVSTPTPEPAPIDPIQAHNNLVNQVISNITTNKFKIYFYCPSMNNASGGMGVLLSLAKDLKDQGF